jgi:predicted Ser/Thr protein kinase
MEAAGVPDTVLPGCIGPYRPLQRLGSGGMGAVFLALDGEGRAVAVKSLHPVLAAAPESRLRLRREVETMQRVRSHRVAEVVDFDLGGSPYIVTRYVQGRSLADVVAARGPLRGEALARVARGLAEALAVVHSAGCVHRDLKPANVMVVDGEPVLIDFGIAHAVDATRVTQQGATGSPGYIAPEVLEGGPVETSADIFAWAGTVVFAATGRHTFGGATPQAVHLRMLAGRPDLDGVPPSLRPLVEWALSPDPGGRPSAGELLSRLSAPRSPDRRGPGSAAGHADMAPEPGRPGRPAGPDAGRDRETVARAGETVAPGSAAERSPGAVGESPWSPRYKVRGTAGALALFLAGMHAGGGRFLLLWMIASGVLFTGLLVLQRGGTRILFPAPASALIFGVLVSALPISVIALVVFLA